MAPLKLKLKLKFVKIMQNLNNLRNFSALETSNQIMLVWCPDVGIRMSLQGAN